jgi:hypothetical protein
MKILLSSFASIPESIAAIPQRVRDQDQEQHNLDEAKYKIAAKDQTLQSIQSRQDAARERGQ